MAEVGLNPAHSKLALPGCKSVRMAFCDGQAHQTTVLVDENGALAPKKAPATAKDFNITTLVAGHSLMKA
jgi:hypothetical protein